MSEITKLYENAGIKPAHYDACKIADAYWLNEELANEYGTFDNYMKLNCIYHYQECTDECRHAYDRDTYPPFTAEKQLELIKWLGELDYLGLMQTTMETKDWIFNSEYRMSGDIYKHSSRARTFEEALAKLINSIWQDLTEEEKQQVKGILE